MLGHANGFLAGKIGKNVERDERDIQRLQALGWRVRRWECALRGRAKLSDAALAERSKSDLRRRRQRADRHLWDEFHGVNLPFYTV